MVLRPRHAGLSWFLTAAVLAAACGSGGHAPDGAADGVAAARPARGGASTPAATSGGPSGRPRIVVLGDSLTAGLGLPVDEAYPSLLQQDLDQRGLKYEVVNAGVSGDTSAGGLSRLDWSLQGDVKVLVVALGGNDALRGLPPSELEGNLAKIIERAQARGVTVVLAGMEAPPNFGADYTVAFHRVYPELARRYHLAFVHFLLDGVAGHPDLNQADGIHPNARGARIVADNVWSVLGPIAEKQAVHD
ncbi:MAG: arylesterase [Betaproteobacteria bacterium]